MELRRNFQHSPLKNQRTQTLLIRESRFYSKTKKWLLIPLIFIYLFPLLLAKQCIQISFTSVNVTNVFVETTECANALDFGINYSRPRLLDRNINSHFLSCVLDVPPNNNDFEQVAVTNSLCPLGRAFVEELWQQGIPFIDIRGQNHLDLTNESAIKILQQFNINSFFHVCPGNNDLSVLTTFISDELITVVSTLPPEKAKADLYVNVPPVFGNVRGKRSDSIEENWFFQCNKKEPLTKPLNSSSQFALAPDVARELVQVAKSLRNHDEPEGNITLHPPLYSAGKLHEMMVKACNKENDYNHVLRGMIERSVPYRSSQRQLTLSIVGCVSTGERFLERFSVVLECYAQALLDYPKLPLEFIIVYSNATEPLDKLITIPDPIKPYIRILKIDPEGVEHIMKKTRNKFFPEFAMKNIGVRRARGEYIVAVNFDSIVQPDVLFDFVLHGQFTYLTLFRTRRLNIPFGDLQSVMENISYNILPGHQYIVNRPDRQTLVLDSSGDFEGAHWRMWERVHGFVEKKYVYHVDSVFLYDIYSQASPLLVKVLCYDYHLMHVKTSNQTNNFPLHNKRFHRNIRKGISSHYTKWKREEWGFPELEL